MKKRRKKRVNPIRQTRNIREETSQIKVSGHSAHLLSSQSLRFIGLLEIAVSIPFIYFAYFSSSFLESVPKFVLSITSPIFFAAAISHFLIFLCFIIFRRAVIFNVPFRNACISLFKLWSVLVIASMFLLSLYAVGAVDGLTNFVKFILPIIGEKISYGISTVITWTISGVIGNVAYALLRKLFYKIQKRNTSNSNEEITK